VLRSHKLHRPSRRILAKSYVNLDGLPQSDCRVSTRESELRDERVDAQLLRKREGAICTVSGLSPPLLRYQKSDQCQFGRESVPGLCTFDFDLRLA
jgi:hypothetical protein